MRARDRSRRVTAIGTTRGGRRPSSTAWHATSPCGPRRRAAAPASRAGSARWRSGQRGWNVQPGGGSSGLGTSPATAVRALPVISRSGTASSSMRVYGCCGSANSVARRRQLDDAAEVHHADAVGDVVDDGEVVRDEEVGEAERALQVAHQVQHLRLHRHVERRRRLVADEERADWSTARARSRCAAAGRRRTGADT